MSPPLAGYHAVLKSRLLGRRCADRPASLGLRGAELFDVPCGVPYFGRAGAEVSRHIFDCRRATFVEQKRKAASSVTRGRMNIDDPIFDAIEAHRRACAVTRAAFENQSVVENELVTGLRVPAGEAEKNSQIAANAAVEEALAVQDDLAVKLLEIQPTTTAGVAALLTYYPEVVTTTLPEVAFPELDANGRPFQSNSVDEPGRHFEYFIVRHVAAALRNMAPAEETSEQHGPANHQRAPQTANGHAGRGSGDNRLWVRP
jgi:hypothetical protein